MKKCQLNDSVQCSRLPVSEKLKTEWIEALKLSTKKLSKYSVVCSLHFNDEDFLTAAKKRLKTEAIPFVSRTVNLQIISFIFRVL